MSTTSSSSSVIVLFYLTITIAAFTNGFVVAQSVQIYIDGRFDDWQTLTPAYSDAGNDNSGGVIDFGRLWISNDEHFLFLNIEVGGEMLMQQSNQIALFLDTDNNSATGMMINGIGAELRWIFGDRGGTFFNGSQQLPVIHSGIGIITAPTVSNNRFEITIDRLAEPLSGVPLFSGNTVRMVVIDLGQGGDELPDVGGISYTFDDSAQLPQLPLCELKRHPQTDLRMAVYNVLQDGPFDPARASHFGRLLKAIQPDIIGFQEIYSHSAVEVEALMESFLPSSGQQQWSAAKVNPDIIIASRYPVAGVFPIDGNGAFLLDLRPDYDSDLLFMVAHPPCCTNDQGRQDEIDAMMAFLRSAREPGGVLNLEPGIPVFIGGDMNLVGDARQLNTLVSGAIVNQAVHGPAFTPDWDGSDLADLTPPVSGRPMTFTWYNPNSSFSPGRLDFLIYTDSVVDSLNQWVLFSPDLPADTLAAYNLQPQDAIHASDHLPVFADFRLNLSTAISHAPELTPQKVRLSQNYPNPFNPSTTIHYTLAEAMSVQLQIFDLTGNRIISLIDSRQLAGEHTTVWNGRNAQGRKVASGIYIYRLSAGEYTQTRRLVLLR